MINRKEALGVVDSLSSETSDAYQEKEKALRRHFLDVELGDSPVHRMPVWLWRLGDALVVAGPNECYSQFQRELRQRFAGTPLLVLNRLRPPASRSSSRVSPDR